MKRANGTWSMCVGGMGLIFAVLFLVTGPVVADESLVTSSGAFTKESNGKADSRSTSPPAGDRKEKDNSPVIGGGVRTPPDIGASGTASPMPPVRTESPTDEPQILPDGSPVSPHPSETESAPSIEVPPLGQPEPLKKRK